MRPARLPLSDGRGDTTAGRVLRIMPSHSVWCEPWFLGGEVFFRKRPSAKEVINDTRDGVIDFYLNVRSRWQQLSFLMETTLPSDAMAALSDELLGKPDADSLHKAWAYWLRVQRQTVCTARWSAGDRLDTSPVEPGVQAQLLGLLSRRLERTCITSRDPVQVIRTADGPDTLFYFCPPDRAALDSLSDIVPSLAGHAILVTDGSADALRMAVSWGFHPDDTIRETGIFTSFRRQRGLFDDDLP